MAAANKKSQGAQPATSRQGQPAPVRTTAGGQTPAKATAGGWPPARTTAAASLQGGQSGRVPSGQPGRVPSGQPGSRRTVIERLTEPSAPPLSPSASVDTSGGDPFNGRSFRLDMVNAAEDIPRVIRAFVKVGKVECALVIRPHDGQGILVHSQDGQAWKWMGVDSDIPQRPEEPVAPRVAIPLLRGAQASLPKQGPVTLRGMWSGKIACDRGQPKISLQRKVASYGVLHIWSDSVAKVWRWQVARTEKWFSRPGQSDGNASSLVVAIQQGLASAMGLLGEACSVRDSRRRSALDSEYAELHPIKVAREGKDPTERFNPKEPKPAKQPSGRGKKAATAAASASPAQPAAVSPAPNPESKNRRTRAPRSPASAPMSVPPPGAAPDAGEIDPAKDKMLLDAFGDAISKALGQLG